MAAIAYPTTMPAPVARTGATAAVASVGVSLPNTVVRNDMIAARLGVSEEWIERRTGIRARHIAGPADRLTDHAARAGERALAKAGAVAADLDLVLVATTTADELLPNAAPLVAHAIGARGAGAFDIGAACTGFLSALAVGSESAGTRSVSSHGIAPTARISTSRGTTSARSRQARSAPIASGGPWNVRRSTRSP